MATALAARQHGVFALWQIDATPSLVKARAASGRWIRIHRGIYRVAGAPETWKQAVMAAVLAGGPRARAAFFTAAALHGIEGFPQGRIEIVVPRSRRVRGIGAKVHEESSWFPDDGVVIDGIPVTTVELTLLHLARRLSRTRLESAVEDALRHRRTTLRRLRTRTEASAGRGHRGVVAMRALLKTIDPDREPTDSELELRFLRIVRAAGLPDPVVHHVVHTDARVVGEIDFAWPVEGIGVEMQSVTWHVGRSKVNSDSRKLTELTLLGWSICAFAWDDVDEHPDWIRDALLRAFANVAQRER